MKLTERHDVVVGLGIVNICLVAEVEFVDTIRKVYRAIDVLAVRILITPPLSR